MGRRGRRKRQPDFCLPPSDKPEQSEEQVQQEVQPLDLRRLIQAELYTFFYGTRAEREVLFGENVREPTEEDFRMYAQEDWLQKHFVSYTILNRKFKADDWKEIMYFLFRKKLVDI